MSTENGESAVIIPAGTEKNLFGGTQAFRTETNTGTETAPDASKGGETTQVINAQGTQAGTTFAELAAKKGFKSADDLARSYAELEAHATKKSMELSELVAAKTQGQQTQKQSQQQNNGSQNGGKDYTPDEAIEIVRNLISSEVAPIKEQLAIRETFKNQEDMQFAPAVAELVRQNPSIPWDVALKAVKFDTVAATAAQAQSQKKQETENLRNSAQAGSTNTRIAPEKNLAGMVTDKNVPFKEVQKAMREAFSQ